MPKSAGVRIMYGEKLRVRFMPKMVFLCFSGVKAASNASPTVSSPKAAKPKTMQGTTSSRVGVVVREYSEMDSTITSAMRILFLPYESESLPQTGALKSPATFSAEKRSEASPHLFAFPHTEKSRGGR